ncbi:MAG: hypothetical protein IPK82_02460 [Polyangiaceae bacterium]|nr:hypothetical protein [Polyangiaceae bacterium]
MNKIEFEAALKRLIEERAGNTENTGCIACTACEKCVDCTFCKGSSGLVRCHYCTDSKGLVDCTHCHRSEELLQCNHCVASERCTRSSYLVRSVDCDGCTYCFGCVGLSKKEFFILNQPYDKSTYFALTGKLMRELGLAGGHESNARSAAPARSTAASSRA